MDTDLSSFIPSYPSRDDPDFMLKMVSKEEIRELLEDPTTDNEEMPFFYNGQVMIGRWMAPWTNNRTLLIFADPGTGKTRMSLSFMTMWMQYSNHHKSLIISTSETILKAFADEVVVYKQHDKELNERKWVVGKKSHGKAIHTTRFVKSKGFEKSTIALVNRIAKERGYTEYMSSIYSNYNRLAHMDQEEADDSDISELYSAYSSMRQELRDRYGDHVITVDEVHIFRQSPSDDKQTYAALIFLLDSLRDICPIVILTATPIVDTWVDLMSVLGMLYPIDERHEISDDVSSAGDNGEEITRVVKKWAGGITSYRSSEGVVPAERPLPGHETEYRIVKDDEEEEIPLGDNIYPVFMSHYQTTVTASYEIKGERPSSLDSKNTKAVSSEAGVYSWRKYYDFVPPAIERESGTTEFMSMEDLITKDQGRYIPSRASYLNAGEDSVFDMAWNDDNSFSTDKGLGKHSAKIAELIRLLKYDPNLQGKAGYVHNIWVQYGTKPTAAALNANGWEQYTGVGEVSSSSKPKFAVIHGDSSSSTKINNIIATFNSDANHDGSLLRLIVGSRKSGISISFTNPRFFIEMSSAFNKSIHIQSKGRVYRVSSLTWLPKNKRIIYSISMVALPSLEMDSDDPGVLQYREDIGEGIIRDIGYYAIADGNDVLVVSPYTIEMRLSYLAQEKFDVSQIALSALKDVSIESMHKRYRNLPSDDVSYNLIYATPHIDSLKRQAKEKISESWSIKFDPNDMAQSKAIASLISNKELVLSNYGIPAPIQDVGDHISSYRGKRSHNPLSLIYGQNFFITEDVRSYNARTVAVAVDIMRGAPTDEYGFYHRISSSAPTNVKVFLLEMILSRDTTIVTEEDGKVLDSKKGLLLSLYSKAWDAFSPSTLVHILWYVVRSGSYVSKLGITSDPEGRSRLLPFDPVTKTSSFRWRYEANPDTESVYLSPLARKIYDEEMEVVTRSRSLGYYIHFSLADGVIRIRQINLKDLRKSRFFLSSSPEVQPFISILLDKVIPDTPDLLNSAIYYASKARGILIIR